MGEVFDGVSFVLALLSDISIAEQLFYLLLWSSLCIKHGCAASQSALGVLRDRARDLLSIVSMATRLVGLWS